MQNFQHDKTSQSPGIAIPGHGGLHANFIFKTQRSRRSCAFSLFEMVVLIALLGIFLTFECKLFVGCVKLDKQVHAAANNLGQWQRMVRVLREDVWAAEQMKIENENTLILKQGTNREIRWELPGLPGSQELDELSQARDGLITRTLFIDGKQTDQAQSSTNLHEIQWSLSGKNSLLVIKARETPVGIEQVMSFMSQASLLKENAQ